MQAETAIFRLSELEAAQAGQTQSTYRRLSDRGDSTTALPCRGLQEKRLERWNQQQMAKEEALSEHSPFSPALLLHGS